jgi:hypothetical protein
MFCLFFFILKFLFFEKREAHRLFMQPHAPFQVNELNFIYTIYGVFHFSITSR